MLVIAVPVLSAVPAWVWAVLVMAGFVALSAFTMWLTRFPVRRVPPPLIPQDGEERDGDRSSGPSPTGDTKSPTKP